MSASFYKFRPGGYAKKLYSVRFWNFDVRVGLQLLVMSEYHPAFTSTPTSSRHMSNVCRDDFFSGCGRRRRRLLRRIAPRNDG